MLLLTKKLFLTSLFLVLVSLSQASAQIRAWTNHKGQQIQAELISIQGDKVQLKLENGLDSLYPINQLSQKDQDFIQLFSENQQEVSSENTNNSTLNWDRPWPKEAQLDLSSHNPIFIGESNGIYTYETAHFIFLSDTKLASTAIRNFSRIFEVTYTYAAAIPFFHDIHTLTDKKIPIEVYNFKEDYIKNGGIPGSAGVCFIQKDKTYIKVCFDYLGVKRIGSNISFDYSGDSTTIPHEIVHALTDLAYYDNDMKWFTEGIAEYMSNTEYSLGQTKYKLISIERYIKKSMTTYGDSKNRGRNLGATINMPKIEKFMTQPNFFDSGDSQKTNLNYGVGCLLTYYFIHLDEDGTQRALKSLLQALKEREAKRAWREITVFSLIEKHLLAERSFEELEEDFAKGMKSLGITINYQ